MFPTPEVQNVIQDLGKRDSGMVSKEHGHTF